MGYGIYPTPWFHISHSAWLDGKVMEDGEVRKTSKFIGKSRVLCDPDHPVKIIYKNGNIRLMFFFAKVQQS